MRSDFKNYAHLNMLTVEIYLISFFYQPDDTTTEKHENFLWNKRVI